MRKLLFVLMVMVCGVANAQNVSVPLEDVLTPIRIEIERAKSDIAEYQVGIDERLAILEKATAKLNSLVVIQPTEVIQDLPVTDEAVY